MATRPREPGVSHEPFGMKRVFLIAAACLALFAGPALAFREEGELLLLVPGLDIRTHFAHDYGEILDSVSYQGRKYTPGEATEKILPALGWKTRSDKLELGTAWAKVFGLHGCEVLQKGHYLHSKEQHEPLAEVLSNGTFRFTAWVADMRGREPGSIYHRRVEISPESVMTVVDCPG